jgi:hypothetical protein
MEWKGVLRLASEVVIREHLGGIEGVLGVVEAGVDLVSDDALRKGPVGQRGNRRWQGWRSLWCGRRRGAYTDGGQKKY